MGLLENYARVKETIARAAEQAGRDPAHVQLVAVSKGQPLSAIAALYAAGQRDFAENRIPEGSDKVAAAHAFVDPADPIRWHFIGTIQSRKAKAVVAHFDVLHALDRPDLAAILQAQAAQQARQIAVLFECNVSGEASKHGFAATDTSSDSPAWQVLSQSVAFVLSACPNLHLQGLMTMAPAATDYAGALAVFTRLAAVQQQLSQHYPAANWQTLSMGMSHDYPAAIAAGATLLRVGSAIFTA